MAKVVDWTSQGIRFIRATVKLMTLWTEVYSLVSWEFLIQTADPEDPVSVFGSANDTSLE